MMAMDTLIDRRSRTAIRRYLAAKRQRHALNRLDPRLRADIGLAPEPQFWEGVPWRWLDLV
jgi:hypothetical protein